MNRLCLVASSLLLVLAAPVARGDERKLELAGQISSIRNAELDETDVGLGARIGFRVSRRVGLEAELSYYPSDIPDDLPVTASRVEALIGITAGPRFDRVSLFGKARAGFVRFGEAPRPVACIAIFPPPLSCVLAGGDTVTALDLGGGIELPASERVLLRADVSDLLLRYPGPALRRGRGAEEESFWSHNLRLVLSAGLRF